MGISRRTFLKGLGGGLTALSLSEVIFSRQGWAGFVHPAKTEGATKTTSICPFCGVGCGLVAYTANGKLVAVEAINTVAQRIKETRDASFIATADGVPVNRTEALACIGGAAINNEECYLVHKLARALGIVYLEHQARL
jgi:formate dehydrogenase major subunit